jgi:hypothetical protein
MTQHTPAWGTPVGATSDSAAAAAETQLLPPVSQVRPVPTAPVTPQRPTREMVELRVTAVHYANKILGEQPTASPDTALASTLRVAKGLEEYLLTGKTA